MSQPQSLSSGKPGGKATLGYSEPPHSPDETTTQGDPATRTSKRERNIIIIPPHRLSDLNLVNYLLAKQNRGYLVQTHIVTEKGRLVLGVRAYPKSSRSPAHVAFIVLETEGEFVGQFVRRDKALQMQVYGMWNTPPDYVVITEKLRKVIPGIIPARHYVAQGRRMEIIEGERLSPALIFARKRNLALHSTNIPAA